MPELRTMFIQNGEDDYEITMPGALLLCADAFYGDPAETSPAGRTSAMEMIDAILGAAFSAGFTQGDVLRTLLARNNPDHRTKLLAQVACDIADSDAIRKALANIQIDV